LSPDAAKQANPTLQKRELRRLPGSLAHDRYNRAIRSGADLTFGGGDVEFGGLLVLRRWGSARRSVQSFLRQFNSD
jgi:hypothetical protein